jgi:hypothetical protein
MQDGIKNAMPQNMNRYGMAVLKGSANMTGSNGSRKNGRHERQVFL